MTNTKELVADKKKESCRHEDIEYKKKIYVDIYDRLNNHLEEEDAESVTQLLMEDVVPHVTINY